mmetsp:Transcript_12306/g.26611  ORF Transcript_12306/g.26611 Transcript_12306/m.26611 type:complete len:184 (-) Transcript_12306:2093-2644(-)
MRDSSSINSNSERIQSPPTVAASEQNNIEVPPHRIDKTDNSHQNNDSSSDSAVNHSQRLPIEYQLYEVDLTHPDMDPLEYVFRKYVPVPKAYFWDTASEANDFNQNLPIRVKFWHRSIYYLGECLKKAEAGGEIVANFLGVNSGPFDYVTGNMTEQEMERSREIVESRREEQEEMERRKEGFV